MTTWKYIPVLNKLLQILISISIGGGAGAAGIVSAENFVAQAVEFVFFVALPCLIVKGIGIGIDFYAETNIWAFIAAFLVLRAVALLLALLYVILTNWKDKRRTRGLGYVAVLWLSLSWISTVIVGVPICSAVFGTPQLGIKYGIMAGVSSFVFQLPVQLMFLECHEAEEQGARYEHSGQQPVTKTKPKDSTIVTIQATPESSLHPDADLRAEYSLRWWSLVHVEHLTTLKICLKISNGLLKNPVVLAITLGFIISLSTAGKYLRCPSEYCVPELGWIGSTLGWIGECVSPVSLFAMGLWMYDQGMWRLFSMRWRELSLHMVSKLIIVPTIMVGLANGMKLNNEAGRAAILIASLPLSMASFSLGRQYNIGEADLATNVAAGTILMLPTVLMWMIVLDKVGLYPISLG